ncbi:MAG TPA: hypothetical protein VJC15_02195 [Candidatus Paceibacterota bacterium]
MQPRELSIYENPTPAVIRDIKNGLAHFPNRSFIPWEAFREDFLVGVAQTREQAELYWNAASKPSYLS